MKILNVKIALLAFLASAIGIARAEDHVITADAVCASIAVVKELGLEGVFLPHKQPVDLQKPELLPFHSEAMLRGVFTPAQLAATTRALSTENLTPKNIISAPISPTTRLDIPSANATSSRAISLTASGLPGNKILVKTYGGDSSTAEEATIEAGQTIVLSATGETTGTVNIYFITIKKS